MHKPRVLSGAPSFVQGSSDLKTAMGSQATGAQTAFEIRDWHSGTFSRKYVSIRGFSLPEMKQCELLLTGIPT